MSPFDKNEKRKHYESTYSHRFHERFFKFHGSGPGCGGRNTPGKTGGWETVQVCGPLGDLVQACYGILPDGKTDVMEMAQASGLSLVPEEKRDPRRATSFGTGQMIREAIRQGCRDFIIGIGGSATTDGGAGMLSALGYEFLDEEGRAVEPGIGALDRIVCIRSEQKPPELEQCRFRIACDVSNPLLGEQGAVWVYGPQKGVREEVHRTGRKGRAGRRGGGRPGICLPKLLSSGRT